MSSPITGPARGRPVVIGPDELEAELDARGPCRSLAHLEAIVRAPGHGVDRGRVIARLERLVDESGPGAQTLQATLGLVRLAARESAASLRALASRLPPSSGAVARAASFLVAGEARALASAIAGDPLLGRSAPLPFFALTALPDGVDTVFTAWVAELRRSATHDGSTAYRAFLGDVGEALYRALALGAGATFLPSEARAFLVDAASAELGGTTDFLAARGLVWLLGALASDDDTARAAIERARGRFRDAAFQTDCDTILAGEPWPPSVSSA